MSSSSASSSSARQRTTCRIGPNTSSVRSRGAVELDDGRRDVGAAGGQRCSSSQRKRRRAARFISAIQVSSFSWPRRRSPGRHASTASRGSPTLSSRTAPISMSSMASATSSCKQSSRSAEQRWPAERNADVITSSMTCSGSAVASTIMALMPPVSAISGTIGPSLAASARLMARRDFGRAGEGNAGNARVCNQRGADFAVAGDETAARCAGTPASCRSRTACAAISGVCSAGLATTELPATSAARDLAGEDRERKIPRADADEDAAAAIAQLVALAGRSGQ